jgi:hypothetical protein
MISSRRRKFLVVLVLAAIVPGIKPSAAGGSATIRNIPPTRHFAPVGTSSADLAAAIKLAMIKVNWRVEGEAPGAIKAAVIIRAHYAVVVIGYDEVNYWIDYVDSTNLDYNPNDLKLPRNRGIRVKGPRIHENYNVWVSQLSKEIVIQARTPPKANPDCTASSRNPILIAEELEKLDALRERGILTQEEFDQQKEKLLAR